MFFMKIFLSILIDFKQDEVDLVAISEMTLGVCLAAYRLPEARYPPNKVYFQEVNEIKTIQKVNYTVGIKIMNFLPCKGFELSHFKNLEFFEIKVLRMLLDFGD